MSEYVILIIAIIACMTCTSIFLIGVGVRLSLFIWSSLEIEKVKKRAREESKQISTEFEEELNLDDLEEMEMAELAELVESGGDSSSSPITATV